MSRSRFRNSRSKRLRQTKRILQTKTRRNPTRKLVPPSARNMSISGRVRERQNSWMRRPSESGHFLIEILFKIDDFGPQQAPGASGGFSGGAGRDIRRAARRDLQDDRRHDPRALVHHVFVLCRYLRCSFVRFFFVTSSSVRFTLCVQRSD